MSEQEKKIINKVSWRLLPFLVLASLLCYVDRVNVGAIVTDARNQFVEGLQRSDFHIFSDGVEQPITGFATIEEPAQVLLMVEAGPAVYLLEGRHLSAALCESKRD